jgi:hypothetical protein
VVQCVCGASVGAVVGAMVQGGAGLGWVWYKTGAGAVVQARVPVWCG